MNQSNSVTKGVARLGLKKFISNGQYIFFTLQDVKLKKIEKKYTGMKILNNCDFK